MWTSEPYVSVRSVCNYIRVSRIVRYSEFRYLYDCPWDRPKSTGHIFDLLVGEPAPSMVEKFRTTLPFAKSYLHRKRISVLQRG